MRMKKISLSVVMLRPHKAEKQARNPNTMKHGKPDLWTLDDGQYWPEEVHHRSSGEVHSREEFPDESDSSICFGR